jgi:glycosyltransferase involved in cell wall biosynthesis
MGHSADRGDAVGLRVQDLHLAAEEEQMIPRVTVLMPVFNRERFLDEAIQSVIAQDFADFELLIVDDGSSDRTPAMLRAWAQRDARIVVITSSENQGIPAALNTGLRHARAPYVARLDSDDIMMPRRLAAQAAVLDSKPEVVLISCAYHTIDSEGNYLGTWQGSEPHEVVTYLLNFYNIVGGGGQVMFRRSEVLAEGGYASEYPSSEDYDLWVRLLRRGRIVTLPLIGMKQRDHDARSALQYASVKRANWTAIMSQSLGRYLQRPIRDEEIAALITVWRHDGTATMAPTAERTMREAFARFCREHSAEELRRCVRNRTARQWMEGARAFANAGNLAEATRFVARAVGWSPTTVVDAALRRRPRAAEAQGR